MNLERTRKTQLCLQDGGGGILGKRADHEDSSRTLGV